MGKWLLTASLAVFFLDSAPAFAQHKMQVCGASGCTCYETWSSVWDGAYKKCMDREAEERKRAPTDLEFTQSTDHCSSWATNIHSQHSATNSMGSMTTKAVPCEAAGDLSKRDAPGNLPDRQPGYAPDPCVKKAESAARECQSSQTQASASCDPANEPSLQGSEGSASGMNDQSNTHRVCGQAAGHGAEFQKALDHYIQRCQSGRSSCEASCAKAQQELHACQTDALNSLRQEVQQNVSICSAGGPLATRAQQASQQREQQAASTQDAANCESLSSASKQNEVSGSGPVSQKAGSESGGSSAAPLLGGAALGTGLERKDSTGGNALSGNALGSPASSRAGSEASWDVMGRVPEVAPGAAVSAGSGGNLFDLPKTPTSKETESINEVRKPADSSSGIFSAAMRRATARLLPTRIPSGKVSTSEKESSRAPASEDAPNLDQFRPQMAGLGRCGQASAAPWAKDPQGCLHGAHKEIWTVIRERYELMKPTLFNDETSDLNP